MMMPTIAPTDSPFDELNCASPPEEYVKPPLETYTLLTIFGLEVTLDGSREATIDGGEDWDMLESDCSLVEGCWRIQGSVKDSDLG